MLPADFNIVVGLTGDDAVAVSVSGDLDTDSIGIRDSKNPAGPRLSVTRADLQHLIGRIKAGQLDR